LDKRAGPFCAELWELLIDAQSNPHGIPSKFINEKRDEIIRRETHINSFDLNNDKAIQIPSLNQVITVTDAIGKKEYVNIKEDIKYDDNSGLQDNISNLNQQIQRKLLENNSNFGEKRSIDDKKVEVGSYKTVSRKYRSRSRSEAKDIIERRRMEDRNKYSGDRNRHHREDSRNRNRDRGRYRDSRSYSEDSDRNSNRNHERKYYDADRGRRRNGSPDHTDGRYERSRYEHEEGNKKFDRDSSENLDKLSSFERYRPIQDFSNSIESNLSSKKISNTETLSENHNENNDEEHEKKEKKIKKEKKSKKEKKEKKRSRDESPPMQSSLKSFRESDFEGNDKLDKISAKDYKNDTCGKVESCSTDEFNAKELVLREKALKSILAKKMNKTSPSDRL
jgi:hypothetical protein